jgi:hypothetical protein
MTEDLRFHPDAARRFQERGIAVLEMVGNEPPPPGAKDAFPSPHIAGVLDERSIKKMGAVARLDIAGNEEARYFRIDDEWRSLQGEEHRQYVDLGESLYPGLFSMAS